MVRTRGSPTEPPTAAPAATVLCGSTRGTATTWKGATAVAVLMPLEKFRGRVRLSGSTGIAAAATLCAGSGPPVLARSDAACSRAPEHVRARASTGSSSGAEARRMLRRQRRMRSVKARRSSSASCESEPAATGAPPLLCMSCSSFTPPCSTFPWRRNMLAIFSSHSCRMGFSVATTCERSPERKISPSVHARCRHGLKHSIECTSECSSSASFGLVGQGAGGDSGHGTGSVDGSGANAVALRRFLKGVATRAIILASVDGAKLFSVLRGDRGGVRDRVGVEVRADVTSTTLATGGILLIVSGTACSEVCLAAWSECSDTFSSRPEFIELAASGQGDFASDNHGCVRASATEIRDNTSGASA